MPSSSQDYEIAAYYFPNFHADPRNESIHGKGWTEWDLLRRALPRLPGHQQPKIPAWGYEDESDPTVFARKISTADHHGVTAFIFDWYFYDDGPFLARALDSGFLGARNQGRLKFALMWANHDWTDIHPAKLGSPAPLLYAGAVTQATFERLTDWVVERYFCEPSYWKIDGEPFFSVYDLGRLIRSFGSVKAAATKLYRFKRKALQAGFPGLHLNAITFGIGLLPGEASSDLPGALEELGINSVTSYTWAHHHKLNRFPVTAYDALVQSAPGIWNELSSKYGVPYFPNVTMGWDASPRTVGSDCLVEGAPYPFTAIVQGNTPEQFRLALAKARRFLKGRSTHRILTINAWNEWTEGSYLEPDTERGLSYLEAIRSVFAPRSSAREVRV